MIPGRGDRIAASSEDLGPVINRRTAGGIKFAIDPPSPSFSLCVCGMVRHAIRSGGSGLLLRTKRKAVRGWQHFGSWLKKPCVVVTGYGSSNLKLPQESASRFESGHTQVLLQACSPICCETSFLPDLNITMLISPWPALAFASASFSSCSHGGRFTASPRRAGLHEVLFLRRTVFGSSLIHW